MLMRWDVLNEFLSARKGRRFLEIGVERGDCARRVISEIKVGVDPEALPGAEDGYSELHRCESDLFFSKLPKDSMFDAVFVDGLHHADQVLRDVDNSLQHIGEDGVVVLHDCNPQSELAQRVPRSAVHWNGDCWKALAVLRTRPDVDAFTIDTDEGLGVALKRPNRDRQPSVLMSDLSYATLVSDRERVIGRVDVRHWTRRLA